MNLKKIKNALLVTLSLALVAAASVAITYAIGDSKSFDPVTNEFKEGSITAKLTEVHWDGVPGNPSGNSSDYTADPASVDVADRGDKMAESYTPGQIIPKDPKVSNTNEKDIDEYVGIKVAYTATFKNAVTNATVNAVYYTKAQFEEAIGKLCNDDAGTEALNANWVATDTAETHFCYTVVVHHGYASTPLFTHVKINSFEKGDGAKYKVKTFSGATDKNGTSIQSF